MSLLRRAGNAWVRKLEAAADAKVVASRRVGPACDLLLDFGRVALLAFGNEVRFAAERHADFRKEAQACAQKVAK